MIADGVHQGYLEVRVAMAAKDGRRVTLPARPWRERTERTDTNGDAARDLARLAALAQKPGGAALAPVRERSKDGPFAGDAAALREAIARGRAEAVARARIH